MTARAQPMRMQAGVETGASCIATAQHSVSVVFAVNLQVLEALCEQAQADSDGFPLPQSIRIKLSQTSEASRERIAHCSVLLVDAGFTDARRWQHPFSTTSSPTLIPPSPWLSPLRSQSLAQSTFLLAWHVCQTDLTAAHVLLGIPRDVAKLIALRPAREIALWARHYADWLQPRWVDRPLMWESLLSRGPYEDRVCVATRGLQWSGVLTPDVLRSPAPTRR